MSQNVNLWFIWSVTVHISNKTYILYILKNIRHPFIVKFHRQLNIWLVNIDTSHYKPIKLIIKTNNKVAPLQYWLFISCTVFVFENWRESVSVVYLTHRMTARCHRWYCWYVDWRCCRSESSRWTQDVTTIARTESMPARFDLRCL